jgi:hypothetical protein
MAFLSDPIKQQDIIDRFGDYVVALANFGISWGLGDKPFPEMDDYQFGGTKAGKPNQLPISLASGTPINAALIYNAVLYETFRFTNIRLMRALLYLTFDDVQTGQFYQAPAGGYIFDQTAKSHLSTSYTIGVNPAVLAAGQVYIANQITRAGLEDLFDRARTVYQAYENSVETITVFVCHSSCHSSCHNSRIRR